LRDSQADSGSGPALRAATPGENERRGIRPAYFELAFGRASQASDPSSLPDYVTFERTGGGGTETALFQGQIDRVDVNESEGVAVAYDYKLSQGAKIEDIGPDARCRFRFIWRPSSSCFLPGYALAGGGITN